jgi:beta-glucosidase-like glycosyl hydrolase
VNIYIFGTKQYCDDINMKLDSQDIAIYLKGEITVVSDATELLDIIKNKNNDDIFLIDDEVISKKDRKKSIFSFFNKQKFLIDEKDIEELAKSTLEASSLDDAVHQIFEIIEDKSMKELDDKSTEPTPETLIDTEDKIELEVIEQKIEDKIKDEDMDLVENDSYDELSSLDISTLEEAFKDFNSDDIDNIVPRLDHSKCIIDSNSDITLLTRAFEQLLTHNKKITITLEVSN